MNAEEKTEILSEARLIRYVHLSDKSKVQVLLEAYRIVFGNDFCVTCTGDIKNAYNRMNAHFQNENAFKQTKMKSKYILKDNTVLYDRLTNKMYTNKNLTDEVAIELLKTQPSYAGRFKTIPSVSDVPEPVLNAFVEHEMEQADADVFEEAETEGNAKTEEQILNDAFAYIDKANKKELQGVCIENNFPTKDWQQITRTEKLRRYVKQKLNEINNS